MAYLEGPHCSLHTLLLNGADVDDGECGNLMNAITNNSTIETLGLNRNLIGQTESYNTVYPDLVTGGEAIGAMLEVNTTIKSLDLSWNAIRLSSAETLGSALMVNSTLLVLNLSHNSFGDFGTQALGFALKYNRTLQELDLSYNSLVPRSACVLTNSLSYNTSLTMLNVDGNIIGKVGMQGLVAAIQRSAGGDRVLKISFDNCDCHKIDPTVFNPAFPDGTWEVDLSKPYGRMVAEECLYLANFRAGCNLVKLLHNGHKINFNRKLEDKDKHKYSIDEYNQICMRAASDLLTGRVNEAAKGLCNILSRQFSFNMPLEVGCRVLETVKKHWEVKCLIHANNPVADVST
jgi:hypothetical protein